jgi:plasmid stabilization system protein ParE
MRDESVELWSPAAKEDIRGIYIYYTRLALHEVAANLLHEIERVTAHIAGGRVEFRERDDVVPGHSGGVSATVHRLLSDCTRETTNRARPP